MKSLILLLIISFSFNVFAGPESKVNPDAGPDEVFDDYDRGIGDSRPDFDSDYGDTDSPWGDVYGDRDSGNAMFSEKQQGDNPPKENERRPQYGENTPRPGQMQGRYNLLDYLLGCNGLFTSFQGAGS